MDFGFVCQPEVEFLLSGNERIREGDPLLG